MRLLIGFLMLCGIVIFAAVSFVKFSLSDQELRQAFKQQIEDQTGYEIDLAGNVGLSFFPDFGLVAGSVSVTDSQAGLSVGARRVVAKVQWLPLFSGKIRIKGLELDNPEIVVSDLRQMTAGDEARVDEDPLKTIASWIDRLEIDDVSIADGRIGKRSENGISWIGQRVNLRAALPGSNKPIWASIQAEREGRTIALEAEIEALSRILNGDAARIDLTASIVPAIYADLEEIAISGTVQADIGETYSLVDGLISIDGQSLAVAGVYKPGDRPSLTARISGEKLELSGSPLSQETGNYSEGKNSVIDLTGLQALDAEIALSIEQLLLDGVAAQAVKAHFALNDGKADFRLSADQFAGGSIEANVSSDVKESLPSFRGAVNAGSLDMAAISKLVPLPVQAVGMVGADLQFAFLGTEPKLALQSLNMAGRIDVRRGSIDLLGLEETLGPDAGNLDDINLSVAIENLERPVDFNGSLTWKGEGLALSGRMDPEHLFANQAIPLELAVNARLFEGRFDGKLSERGQIKGKTEFQTGEMPRLLAWIGQPIDGLPASVSYNSGVEFDPDAKNLKLSNASFQSDAVKAKGDISLDFRNKPIITASLAFEDLDTAAFMGGAGAENGSASSDETSIDLAFLNDFDADARFRANRIIHDGLVTGAASGQLEVSNGQASFRLDPTSLYDGQLEAALSADATSGELAIDIDLNIKNADGLRLLDNLAGFDRVEGKLDLGLALAGTGKTSTQLTRSLNGKVDLRFADGALKGISVTKVLQNLRSVTTYGFEADESDRTEFTELTLGLDVDGGIAETRDFRMIGPFVRMDGSGKIDLNTEELDLSLKPKLVGSLSGQGGIYDLSGIEVPVRVTGNFASPRIYPDVKMLLSDPQKAVELLGRLEGGMKGLGANGLKLPGLISKNLKTAKPGAQDVIGGLLDAVGSGTGERGQAASDGKNGIDLDGVVGTIAKQALGDRLSTGGLQGIAPGPQAEEPNQAQTGLPVPTSSPLLAGETGVSDQPKLANRSLDEQLVDKAVTGVIDERKDEPVGGLLKGILNRLQ